LEDDAFRNATIKSELPILHPALYHRSKIEEVMARAIEDMMQIDHYSRPDLVNVIERLRWAHDA